MSTKTYNLFRGFKTYHAEFNDEYIVITGTRIIPPSASTWKREVRAFVKGVLVYKVNDQVSNRFLHYFIDSNELRSGISDYNKIFLSEASDGNSNLYFLTDSKRVRKIVLKEPKLIYTHSPKMTEQDLVNFKLRINFDTVVTLDEILTLKSSRSTLNLTHTFILCAVLLFIVLIILIGRKKYTKAQAQGSTNFASDSRVTYTALSDVSIDRESSLDTETEVKKKQN